MTEDGFRRVALALNGVEEREHMGHPDFRAHGRIFATLHGDGRSGMVKLTPEQQRRFVQEDPDAFAPENGAWGRNGCTRVTLARVGEDPLGEAMTLAWQNVGARLKPRAPEPGARPKPRAPNRKTRKRRSS